MMYMSFSTLIVIAYRNLARHKVKTLITALAITISVAVYIFADAFLSGINLDSKRNIVNYEAGAAKIQTRLYFDKKDELPMYENFKNWQVYADLLHKHGYDTAPRYVFNGTLYSSTGNAPIEFYAVNPADEERMLRYPAYMETGRFIRPGSLEIALGTMAADKLKIGIPQRLTKKEFEEELLLYGQNEDDFAFMRSLYESLSAEPYPDQADEYEEERLVLKKNLPQKTLKRFWELLATGGRMDIRISVTIDMKFLPPTIQKDRFDMNIASLLSGEEINIFMSTYGYDDQTQAYTLKSSDEGVLKTVLDSLVRINYTGAFRHVNQLVDAVVVGIINSPNPKNNYNAAYIPIDSLQDEAGLMLEGHITELLIRKQNAPDAALPGKDETPEFIYDIITRELSQHGLEFPRDLGIYGWIDYASDYISSANGDNVIMTFMVILLFVLSFIGIGNTMLMSIMERTKEIGMLRSLGMTDKELAITYMLEAGFVGLIGSIAGIALGCLVNFPMVEYGVDMSSMMNAVDGDFGYRIASLFRSTWRPQVILGIGFVVTTLSSIMALLPVYRAMRKPITEILRFE
jgi:ABC-type lipoprotein release transport system permease subunit